MYKAESKIKKSNRPRITCSKDAADLLKPVFAKLDPYAEHFIVMALNNKNEVQSIEVVAKGTPNSCEVSMSVLFRHLIVKRSVNCIVAHNHPSDDTGPSSDDVALTKRIRQAGEILSVNLLDHLVVNSNVSYYTSLADRGLI